MSFTPEQVNHGLWMAIHVLSTEATDFTKKIGFANLVPALGYRHPCLNCRQHFKEFLATHPFHKYWDHNYYQGKDVGLFRWTVDLHNYVNRQTGKRVMPFEEAYQLYYHSFQVCTDCGS